MKAPTIVLLALAVPLAGLSAAGAYASVNGAQDAIAAITESGKVTFSEESRQAIDAAVEAVDGLDENFAGGVGNLDDLQAAEVEYARLAIKTADQADRRKLADGISDEEVAQAVQAAREAVDAYFDEDSYQLVPNYDDLVRLEASYAAQLGGEAQAAPSAASSDAAEEDVEVELC